MHDKNRNHVENEIAVLVRVLHSDYSELGDPLEELTGLATTAGSVVLGGLVQRRDKPDPATYIGKGKVDELERLVEFHAADVVIFDNNLSPGQIRNLEQRLEIKVLDRTELILDIFATRAKTYEARLAVELAQLEYSLPRLKRMWTHLSRIKMGVGMRGPGEKQLEVDRRLVEKRIYDLRADLDKIEKRKERTVAARSDNMTVSLVGYTNAGKSTLMNALTDADVLAADKLFATLDTRTRRWHLPSWGPVLLSDTVGFIRDLPHRLVTSFKATLEEAHQADLLLHIADASHPDVIRQITAVYKVLEEIGIEEKQTLLVLNKIDKSPGDNHIAAVLRRYPRAIQVSAKTGQGLDLLHSAVSDALSRSFRDVEVETAISNGRLPAFLAANGEIISTKYSETRVTIHCRISSRFLGKIHDADSEIRYFDADRIEQEPGPSLSIDQNNDQSMDEVA